MAIEFMYLQCTWQWAMPGTSCLVVDSTHPSVMRMPQSLLPFQFHSVVVNQAISWQRWSNRGIPRRPVEHSTYASGMIHWILATAFSFSGSMVRISSILEFGCSLIIGQSRGRTMSLDDGSLPPPPNPPPMTEEEKQEAAIYRVNNPPKCHCGVRAKLQRPNIGVPQKFTPFFRCSLKTRVSVM